MCVVKMLRFHTHKKTENNETLCFHARITVQEEGKELRWTSPVSKMTLPGKEEEMSELPGRCFWEEPKC